MSESVSSKESVKEPVSRAGGALPEKESRNIATDANDSPADRSNESEMNASCLNRFSRLSSEMINLITRLFHEVKTAADQLRSVEAELNLKKNELKALYDLEGSIAELERKLEERRSEATDLERNLESRRHAFEQKKSRWEQEEKEYIENLKRQRQREEEEYRQKWGAEQSKARQTLEEELLALRQKSVEEQEILSRSLSEREKRIEEKESEWMLLMQELEKFVSALTKRVQVQHSTRGIPSDWIEALLPQSREIRKPNPESTE